MKSEFQPMVLFTIRIVGLIIISLLAGVLFWSRFYVWELQDVVYGLIEKGQQHTLTDAEVNTLLNAIPSLSSFMVVILCVFIFNCVVIFLNVYASEILKIIKRVITWKK